MIRREEPDGLIIITPVHLTEQIVSEIIPAQIPLLIEKPPGANAESANRLKDLAAQYHTPVMVSFNRCFNPAVVVAME